MEFGPGFWGPIVATGATILGAFIGWLLLVGSHRIFRPRPTNEKVMTYTCGEDIGVKRGHPSSEEYYSPVRRVFGKFFQYVRPAHSGILNTYLFWAIVGLIVILVAIALALR